MNARTLLTMMALLAVTAGCKPAPAEEPVDNAQSVENTLPPVPDNVVENVATPVTNASVTVMPVPGAPEDLPASNAIDDASPFPDEVTDFMVTRDSCDHFRGEEGYDAERRAFLEDNIRTLCSGTDAKLAALRKRYAKDAEVAAALSNYEDSIEAPES